MSISTLFRLCLLTLLSLLPLAAFAVDEDQLLPVEEAFALKIESVEADRVHFSWRIHEGYYLYRERVTLTTDNAGIGLGKADLPEGEVKDDEFFGRVQIWRGEAKASVPFARNDLSIRQFELVIGYQGCADLGVCYPPHRQRFQIDIPEGSPTALSLATSAPLSSGGLVLGGANTVAVAGEPLPEEQAFVFEAIADGNEALLVRWVIAPGYYLYRDKTTLELIEPVDAGFSGDPLQWPGSESFHDEHFGDVQIWRGEAGVRVPVLLPGDLAHSVLLEAKFQGCLENGICYPPMTRTVSVDLPAGPRTLDREAMSLRRISPAPVSTDTGNDAVTLTAQPDTSSTESITAPERTPPPSKTFGLFYALLLAFGGGLILNLMPCVLPVLSLKVLGLAQSGESHAAARKHALWYTAGVMVSFAVVGLAAIGLRSAGEALGWGFQLQQPAFVGTLVFVMLAMGLSLSGVITIGAGLSNIGSGLASHSGPKGDFFTGVLACVVASPCTAPLMGSALAYAFAQPPAIAILIFLVLGLGLAAPFLMVGFVPALATRLPRPGAWMETFKQFLAFPMYLTAVWLAWVLARQKGADSVGLVMLGSVLLALALWLFERLRHSRGGPRKLLGQIFAVLVLATSLGTLYLIHTLPAETRGPDTSGALVYSESSLAGLRGEGKAVFVNMTADWCTTCKLNERSVLSSDAFKQLLADADMQYMKGDYTNVDPAIAAFLQRFDAVGVPLYVVFGPGSPDGEVLPTLLTDGIVRDAISRAAKR